MLVCDSLFPERGWRFMRRAYEDEVVREKEYIQSDYPSVMGKRSGVSDVLEQ